MEVIDRNRLKLNVQDDFNPKKNSRNRFMKAYKQNKLKIKLNQKCRMGLVHDENGSNDKLISLS